MTYKAGFIKLLKIIVLIYWNASKKTTGIKGKSKIMISTYSLHFQYIYLWKMSQQATRGLLLGAAI